VRSPLRIPPPEDLGFNSDKFAFFRPAQFRALRWLLRTDKKFAALCAPTGIGKSLINLAYARLFGMRTVVLTSTNSLLDQLSRDFGDSTSFQAIKGKRNYPCAWNPALNLTADKAPCNIGMDCVLRDVACDFYRAFGGAMSAEVVCTNYQWWLNQVSYGQGIGDIDLLILDEAHNAPEELAQFLAVELWHEWDVPLIGNIPYTHVRGWALAKAKQLTAELKDEKGTRVYRNRRERDEALRKKSLVQRLERLAALPDADWVRTSDPRRTRWDAINPAAHAHVLFQGAKKVVFSSATLMPKTLEYLGLGPDDVDFREFASTFPAASRPVYLMPTVKVNYQTTPGEYKLLVNRLDRILDARMDRRGIIQVSSYAYARQITELSSHCRHMLLHRRGAKGIEETLERFRGAPPPVWLVSPALKEGHDLPYDDCEVVVEAKIPWPNPTDPVIAARSRLDPEYSRYKTVASVVQGVGRGMRADDDRCEAFILDASVKSLWFSLKKYAPRSFMEACQWREGVPPAPPPISAPKFSALSY
jgi:ATP-dependent DNA helicase DinG